MVLSVVFIKLKCMWLHTGLSDLKKKHQTIEMLRMVDCLRIFFDNTCFENFQYF